MLRYGVTLKCWNRFDFYSSDASVMSEQLTRAATLLSVQRNYFYRQKH